MSDSIVLEAEAVWKRFKKGKSEIQALRGVNFAIREGETVAITGASGAGKSTLLHVLGTLEAPTSGRVLFGPKRVDLSKATESDLAKFRGQSLGFVFQFHYLLPEFNALENVMMPALISGVSRPAAERAAREILGVVGLLERLDHRPAEMSGGEQQRVAIARAVILRPKVLLADELTGNLDSTNSARVVELLTELHRLTGVTILMVTHDLGLASKMGRVVNMKDGVVVA